MAYPGDIDIYHWDYPSKALTYLFIKVPRIVMEPFSLEYYIDLIFHENPSQATKKILFILTIIFRRSLFRDL